MSADLNPEQRERIHRLGYLFDAYGHPYLVPDELLSIYCEVWPDLGIDRED